ncbi:MAG: tetratricopeptide repeat protein, partial [Bacteroidota bacterium]
MNRFSIIYCLLILLNTQVFGQQRLSTKSKKAAELYYQADNFRVRGQYAAAIDLLNQAIKKDDKFYEAYFRLGVIRKAKGDLKEAEELLLKVLELDNDNAGAFFELSELNLKLGRYQESLEYINSYFSLNPRNSRRIAEAKTISGSAQFGIENAKTISEFNPRALSPTVNRFAMQYFPIVTVDQRSIIYTRRLGTTINADEDIVISYKDDNGEWQAPESISQNINTEFNEGTCTISADGRTLILTSCVGRKGFGSCDLFISYKYGEEWTAPLNLGSNINSSSWDSQPSLSADGRTLYFVSNRRGGVGRRDIWVSYKDDNDQWSKAKNLGRKINSVNDEVSPFIHPNNKTLYFASNGWPGFGGLDIFYSNRDSTQWQAPENFG